jgi:hypothetical protein
MATLDKYKTQKTAAQTGAATNGAPLIPNQDLDRLLDGMDGTEPGASYTYFRPGRYLAEITKVVRVEKRDHTSMIAVETRIIESTNPECPAGSSQSWTQKLQGVEPDQVLRNLMGFLLAAEAPDTAEDRQIIIANGKAMMKDACGEEQTLAGRRLVVECKPYVIKKGANQGKTTNICNFFPAPKT